MPADAYDEIAKRLLPCPLEGFLDHKPTVCFYCKSRPLVASEMRERDTRWRRLVELERFHPEYVPVRDELRALRAELMGEG